MSVKVYIDADNCPNLVLSYTEKYCRDHELPLILVANHSIQIKDGKYEMVICEKEKDAADNYIFEHAEKTDLVVTKDIILASRLVEQQIKTINDRGTLFDKYNIKDRLADSAFDFQLAQLGLGGKKGSSYNEKQLAKYVSCFENAIKYLNSL